MNYEIKINSQYKYIHYTHKGVISRGEIGKVWSIIFGMDEFINGGYDILSDYRGGSFDFGVTQLDRVREFLSSHSKLLNGRKNAVIVDNPKETAISFLFEESMYSEINFRVRVFSTFDGAVSFLIKRDILL